MQKAERLSSRTVMQKFVIGSGSRKMQLTSLTRFWIGIVSVGRVGINEFMCCMNSFNVRKHEWSGTNV